MTDKNITKLINRFPSIFNDNFIIECDDGWYDLIFDLCRDIQHEINNSGCNQVTAVKVKEKFGLLHFVADGGNEVTEAMISKYKKVSGDVCEITGGKGYMHQNNGWLKTLSLQTGIIFGFKKV